MLTPSHRRFLIIAAAVCGLAGGTATAARAQSATAIAPELGLTPESLVMAGFQPADASLMLQRIDAAATQRQSLATAHAGLDAAIHNLGEALRMLGENPTDPELLQQASAARQAVVSARGALAQAQAALAELVLDGFAAPLVEELEDYRSGEPYRVPPAFRADPRNASEWRLIEAALRMETRCDRTGEELPQEYTQVLTTVRLDPDVVLAQARLDTGLAAMRQVFESH